MLKKILRTSLIFVYTLGIHVTHTGAVNPDLHPEINHETLRVSTPPRDFVRAQNIQPIDLEPQLRNSEKQGYCGGCYEDSCDPCSGHWAENGEDDGLTCAGQFDGMITLCCAVVSCGLIPACCALMGLCR